MYILLKRSVIWLGSMTQRAYRYNDTWHAVLAKMGPNVKISAPFLESLHTAIYAFYLYNFFCIISNILVTVVLPTSPTSNSHSD